MTNPLVTIGLPVYNGEKYLRNALDDLLAQDCPDFELIICDNASTDSTLQICQEYKARDSRIKIDRSEQNLGAIRNFNKAFDLCTGKYFMWAAYDDRWHPAYLRRCVEELEKHPQAALCASDLVFIDADGNESESLWEFQPTLGLTAEERIHSLIARWGWYAIYGVIRPEFLRKVRGIQNVVGPDVLLLAELSFHGEFVKVPEKLFYYRFFEDKSVAESVAALDIAGPAKKVTQFNTDLARDLWHAINESTLDPERKKSIQADFLETLAFANTKWRDAIIAENPLPVYKRAGDQVPRIALKRHLYRLFKRRSEKGTAIFQEITDANHSDLISPRPSHPTLPVRWMAPIFNPSGYASEAINFILPLADKLNLGILHQNNIYSEKFVSGLSEADRQSLFSMRDRFAELRGGIVVSHQPANGFSLLKDGEYHIGRSMYETDRIPAAWVAKCNLMDEIWVPSEFNRQTFAASGVSAEKIVVIPGAVDAAEFDPSRHSALPLPNRAKTKFLSVFEWSTRKGWDVLLAAYLQEFSAADDVCLYLRTYLMSKPDGDPAAEIWRRIRDFAETLKLGDKPWPRIEILAEQTATADLPRLYKAVDCLVAPSRGEGWGRPHHEAMMMGLPVIATGWSGNTEFMTPENSYLIGYELEEATRLEPELWHYQGHRWARASVAHLSSLMRRVVTHPEERAAKGARARADMIARFSREAVSKLIIERLTEIQRKLSTPERHVVAARSQVVANSSSNAEPVSAAWEGSFLDYGSLSQVNRAFAEALAGSPALKLALVSTPGSPAHPELELKKSAFQSEAPADVQVTIRHSWPPNWRRPKRGAWVHIQPWEYGALPREWVDRLQNVNQIWTYSNYLRQVYIDSGIAPDKVKVVPLGIDPARFRPDAMPLPLKTTKKFKFLFVGGTISRKGPDVLIQSYLDAFTAADDVCLVVKDFGSNGVYKGQTCSAAIREAASRPGAPEVIFVEEELPPSAMASLYCACDCLIHPYRGEGFGLPVLEAMACGLPVVVTANGATDDFATDEFAYRIPSIRESIGDRVADFSLARNGWLLEPDGLALTDILRSIVSHRDEARDKGARASAFVREHWTWERAAAVANHHVQALVKSERCAAEELAAKRARKLDSIPLAPVGHIGSLKVAQEHFNRSEHIEAWNAACIAIAKRPFHPRGWLMLSSIAVAAGDFTKARQAVEQALQLAPEWVEAKRIQKQILKARGGCDIPELSLPSRSFGTRLSVCMIVRNEEKFLGQALSSVKAVAHEMIVVDTGSTDRTVEIAREFGAQVHSFKWCDDFSAARNAALEHATGDWILFLDADEQLSPGAEARLRADLSHRKTICYRVPLVEAGREAQGRSYVPRLFRNGPGFFFFGRVHEEIFFSIEPLRRELGLENRLAKIELIHHGYSQQIAAGRGKSARNLQLLELAVDEWPNQPNLLINYALELSRAGRTEEAVQQTIWACESLMRAPATQSSPEFREFLLTRAAEILMGARRFQDVLNLFATPFAKAVQPTASQHFLLGICFMEKTRFEEAAGHFLQALRKRSQPGLTPAIQEIFKGGPNHCLGLCLARLKQTAEAEKALRAALAEEPSSKGARMDLARLLRTDGRAIEALELLCAGVEHVGNDVFFWGLGGDIALSQPEFCAFAKDWTSQAIQFAGDDPLLCQQRAEALLLNGEVADAISFWRKTDFRRDVKCAAALLLAESVQGNPAPQLGFDEAALSHAFIEWYRKLIAVNASELIQRLHTRLPRLSVHIPTAVRLLQEAIKSAECEMEAAATS